MDFLFKFPDMGRDNLRDFKKALIQAAAWTAVTGRQVSQLSTTWMTKAVKKTSA